MSHPIQLSAHAVTKRASRRGLRNQHSMGWILGAGAIVVLALYSAVLLAIEWNHSQEYVREFFSDIIGPERFYAINTTLCVFLLGATALLFLVCLQVAQQDGATDKTRLFYISQVVVFAYLGFDDRFRVHEWLGEKLGTADHYYLMLVAVAEFVLLITIGRERLWLGNSRLWLLLATVCFVVMIGVDALAPHDGFMRLSIEDLAKTWGCFFFFLFAWDQLGQAIRFLRARADAD
ncbi:MAG: hypothetical protein MI725_08585 [Pirellulales bacterium]|nr:hypothetical protein [Pirellulales bacterium]